MWVRVPSLRLHDVAALRALTLRRLGLAAALVSGATAPVLCSLAGYEFNMRGEHHPLASPEHEAIFTLVLTLPAAWLGLWSMRSGVQKGTNVALFSRATGAGLLFCFLSAFAHYFFARNTFSTQSAAAALLPGLCSGIFFGVHPGFAFGAVFRIGVGPRMNLVLAPSQAAPAQAAVSCAGMLMVAAVLAHALDVSALVLPIHALIGMEPEPSTLSLWLSVPLALSAAPLLLFGMRELLSLHRARRMILHGTHPEYYPGDIAPDEDAIPLTEADRRSANKRALMRRESSAYRGGEGNAVRVYVGVR